MKALLVFLLVAAVAHGAETKHANTTLTLKNGKVFRSVKITSETDDAVFVRYNAGIVKIFKSELSAEMQKEYPTLQQREKTEAEHQQREAARIRAERDAEAAENQALKLTPRTPYDFTMLDTFTKSREQSRSRSISVAR